MSEEDFLEKIQVWTFGHSNRSMEKFLELLREHEIQVLADVRRFPNSKAKHFKKELMEKWLPEHGWNTFGWVRSLGDTAEADTKSMLQRNFSERNTAALRNRGAKARAHHVLGGKPEVLPSQVHLSVSGKESCESYTYNRKGTNRYCVKISPIIPTLYTFNISDFAEFSRKPEKIDSPSKFSTFTDIWSQIG
jgi:hypothetical protein